MNASLKRLVIGASLATLAWPVAAQTSYVIQVTPGTDIGALANQYQLSVTKTATTSSATLGALSSVQPLSAAALSQISSTPGVTALDTNSTVSSPEASPSSLASAATTTSVSFLDALFSNHNPTTYYGQTVLSSYVYQPATGLIRLNEAQSNFGAGAGAVVAVIDTGVDTTHPALSGVLVPGYDFTRQRPDTVSALNDVSQTVVSALQQSTVEILDSTAIVAVLAQSTVEILDQSTVEILDGEALPSDFGHGTMVAGLVHLVAPQAQIMPLKAFHADGTAQLIDVASAIYYATDHGANVINMSFGYSQSSPILAAAIAYAQNQGVICVASAGNQGLNMVEYPEEYRQVIGVGSTTLQDQRSSFSNYGSATDIAAPGEGLVTLFPGGTYAAGWGTSFSTALISGAAALGRSVTPRMGPVLFQSALNQGVAINQGMGTARLQLVSSLTFLLQPH